MTSLARYARSSNYCQIFRGNLIMLLLYPLKEAMNGGSNNYCVADQTANVCQLSPGLHEYHKLW